MLPRGLLPNLGLVSFSGSDLFVRITHSALRIPSMSAAASQFTLPFHSLPHPGERELVMDQPTKVAKHI